VIWGFTAAESIKATVLIKFWLSAFRSEYHAWSTAGQVLLKSPCQDELSCKKFSLMNSALQAIIVHTSAGITALSGFSNLMTTAKNTDNNVASELQTN